MEVMTTATHPAASERFVLNNADWGFYDDLLARLDDRRVFVTYDRGRLEVMAPSWSHASDSRSIGLLIHVLADELNVPIKGGGSTTFRRQDLDRGLEPDQCFYTKNELAIRGKREINLAIDPPPDLAVEVEISRRLLDRVGIYAALGVPELWRYDGDQLRVFILGDDRQYHPCDRSPTFPTVPLERMAQFVGDSRAAEETGWSRRVRAWVRQNLTPP